MEGKTKPEALYFHYFFTISVLIFFFNSFFSVSSNLYLDDQCKDSAYSMLQLIKLTAISNTDRMKNLTIISCQKSVYT